MWVFDAEIPQALDALQQFVKKLAGSHVVAPASAKPSAIFYQEYPGNVAAWSLDGKQFFARTGNRLILANRGDVLKALFTPHPKGAWLVGVYTQASVPPGDTAAWAFVNMATLNQYPPARNLAEGTAPFDTLNGGWKQSLRDSTGSPWSGTSMARSFASTRPLTANSRRRGRLHPTRRRRHPPNLTCPRELAACHAVARSRQILWGERSAVPAKDFRWNPGREFHGDLLHWTRSDRGSLRPVPPQVRLVVARQQYDPAIGTPVEQYPAAALVFRVRGREVG